MPQEICKLSKETFMQQYVLKRARAITEKYVDGRMMANEAEQAYEGIKEACE